ncbi:D-3-phosphoglycerate dehydrogenase-like [Planococcus citri]|uniref:D-3-phosphoglycerate dehydrogenase-like n=1 Tax=Planococcus citri TaxID=170843 RepID=UPI0031F80024
MSVKITKVLISDNVDQKCEDLLTANGVEVVRKCNLKPEELIKELENCNGLIVRSETKVTKEILDNAKSLKVIGRAGTGVDNIDVTAATRRGIIVLNAPNGNSISACELACSFITILARNITGACQSMKEGRWDRKAFSNGSELLGKTLAIIGLGRIGKEVAIRMKSFGMQVVGYDPFVTAEEAKLYSIVKMELDDIWPLADYITIHTPLIPQTRNLLNKSVFARCKREFRIVNAARGGIINEEDLLEALNNGTCAGAALDVFSEEPPSNAISKNLIAHPKVIATPHLGASTKEAQTRVAVEVAEQFVSLNDASSEYKVTGILNAPALLASRQSENAAWLELAEQLGRVISRISKEYTLKGSNIKITLAGPEIQNMKFLSTSVLLGLLSGNIQNGYNLINSPLYAKEAGLNFFFEEFNDKIKIVSITNRNILKISAHNDTVPLFSAEGTVIDNVPYLLQINDAAFPPASVQLLKNIQIYSCDIDKVSVAISAAMSNNEKVTNLSIAYGKQAWIALIADKLKDNVAIPENVRQF